MSVYIPGYNVVSICCPAYNVESVAAAPAASGDCRGNTLEEQGDRERKPRRLEGALEEQGNPRDWKRLLKNKETPETGRGS